MRWLGSPRRQPAGHAAPLRYGCAPCATRCACLRCVMGRCWVQGGPAVHRAGRPHHPCPRRPPGRWPPFKLAFVVLPPPIKATPPPFYVSTPIFRPPPFSATLFYKIFPLRFSKGSRASRTTGITGMGAGMAPTGFPQRTSAAARACSGVRALAFPVPACPPRRPSDWAA